MAVFVWVWEVCAVVAVAIRAAASLNEGKEEGQVGRRRGAVVLCGLGAAETTRWTGLPCGCVEAAVSLRARVSIAAALNLRCEEREGSAREQGGRGLQPSGAQP
eukprot:COSAG02_NODE_5400_length_4362_cov_3.969505_5_plen_104_part_00